MTLSVTHYIVSNDWTMINESESMQQQAVVADCGTVPALPCRDWENHEKTQDSRKSRQRFEWGK
jgi:hypothetical protein